MVFSFKMSHQEAWSGNNCWSYGWYCETCHWPWKSPKKSLFCLKCKMFQLFCILDFFGFHHWKVEITSFPNMYNTYRVTVKLRQLHPGEKWEVWKIWNVNKNRAVLNNQKWVLFLGQEQNRRVRLFTQSVWTNARGDFDPGPKKVPTFDCLTLQFVFINVTNFHMTSNSNYSTNFLARMDFHTIFQICLLSAFWICIGIQSHVFGNTKINYFKKVIFEPVTAMKHWPTLWKIAKSRFLLQNPIFLYDFT